MTDAVIDTMPTNMTRHLIFWASLSAAMAVAAGAFAAHGLKSQLSTEMLAVFETAARYQMYHALALLVVAWVNAHRPSKATRIAALAFAMGTLLFCGSLYVLALTNIRLLGAITPFGGVAFLIGWISLALAGRQIK